MGDGTGESHHRMEMALEEVWPYIGEMFDASSYENLLIKNRISVHVSEIKNDWEPKITSILREATLSNPGNENMWMQKGGKSGFHSEHLGYILAEMQFLQRAYPGCEW